jgi:malate dehydrogenase (oxaloacetate-decarboxylating)(NADP+)
LLSFSNFGNPTRPENQRVRDAVALLDARKPDFEYDGEMSADVALDFRLMRDRYPFCRLTGPANVLIMPGLHSANLGSQLLEQLGGGVHVGPLIIGLSKPAQVLEMGSTVSDLVNLAALAAHEAIR